LEKKGLIVSKPMPVVVLDDHLLYKTCDRKIPAGCKRAQ
jgi:hypothetical protein